MDIATKLAQFNADPALTQWVMEQLNCAGQAQADKAALQEQLRRKEQDLHAKECKIQALTLELAYHKRLKFSAKAEAFTVQQRDLFLECEQSDVAAMQAELAQLSVVVNKDVASLQAACSTISGCILVHSLPTFSIYLRVRSPLISGQVCVALAIIRLGLHSDTSNRSSVGVSTPRAAIQK